MGKSTKSSPRKLDFSKIKFSEEPLSMKEALEDVVPFEWPEDVLSGMHKITVYRASQEEQR